MASIENNTSAARHSVRKSSWLARLLGDERGLTTMEILALIAGLIVMVTIAAPVLQQGAQTGATGVVKRLTDWTGSGQ